MSLRFSLLAVLAVSSVTTRGETCSCVAPIAWVSPGPVDPAPLNAHLMVTFDEHAEWCAVPGNCVATESTVALRVAAHDGVPASMVPTHVVHETPLSNFVHQELAPDAALAPKTRYEVLLVDGLGKAPVRVVGTFVTRTTTDVAQPEWSATIDLAELSHPSSMISCGDDDTMALRVSAVKDESAIRWEIFVTPGDVAIDWTKPPTAVQLPTESYPNGKSLLVVGYEPCSASVALPKSKSVRVGVRPVDVAGNRGREAEVVRAWPAKKP
jgi:hypothetical protein